MKIATICVSGVEAAALDRKSITMGLAGATVEFEYTDPMWSGLTKNVVFDGATTVAVSNAGTVVEVPAAVLSVKNTPVRVGVCGIGGDGSVVVPTIWADIGVVRSSAFGQFPPPAEVPLPVWAQVMALIGDLNKLTTEAKENLVAAINEAAASGGGSGVDANTLQAAINAALAQAKTSGEFDGAPGKSAYQYAKDGGFTGTEEEFAELMAKGGGNGSGQNVDLTGYATEKWVQDGYQPKGVYLTKAPVDSVNGKTGAVSLSAADVNARPDTWTPTAQEVGALPATYTPPNQTAQQVGADPKGTAASAVSQHNTADDSHGDIRLELKAINDRLTAFFDSDNQTLDELSEIVAYITSNKSLIDAITTSKVSVSDIVNNLTTNVANKPLSAAQGVVLKGLIDAVSNSLSNYQPKGDYALASQIPTVPTKVSAFTNDAGYLTQHQDISGKLDANKLPEAINTALAQAKESGEFDGKDGTSATHSWNGTILTVASASGTSSANLKGGKGDPGSPGADGVSPTVAVSKSGTVTTISITDKNGTKTATVNDGDNGYTPVRGTDYWTTADQEAIVQQVIAALPIYNGEVI